MERKRAALHILSRGDGMLIPTTRPGAVAQVRGGREAPELTGTVRFFPMWGGVLVSAQLRGLPGGDGIFGFHIHEGESCGGENFADTGAHFDLGGRQHPNHTGDLLPLFRCCGGRAYLAFVTSRFTIRDIIGRTVVIHSGPDDFRTQPAGNSGTKIACGVIKRW